jgi:phenylacetate-CoA ligase
MSDFTGLVRSALPGILWPPIPSAEGALALALQFELERSQWLEPRRLLECQLRQLEAVLEHAWRTVPFYREHWGGAYEPGQPISAERFARLPLLRRKDLQRGFDALRSTDIPRAHGPVAEVRTSGSTGAPVRVLKTGLVEIWWRAFTLRDHVWHRRDLAAKLAAIRVGASPGRGEGWGPATSPWLAGGEAVTLPAATDVHAQLEWLEREQPDYLLTHPSNLAALARAALARGVRLPRLREARTSGEALGEDVRDLCRRAWGVAVKDMYSASEVGYIALQCPEHEHYHVQAEGVLVEVLDERGEPCLPGSCGRIVVTSLHNFAMPLVRYELGDLAEPGPPCACGRSLPVLRRILGRVRHLLVLPDGRRIWPSFNTRAFPEIAPVLQHQFVQKGPELIEARLVTARPLTAEEEASLRRHLLAALPARFEIRFLYLERIARGPGGKFEDFVCELGEKP